MYSLVDTIIENNVGGDSMSKSMSEQMQKLADRYEKATGKKFDVKTNAQKIRAMTDEEIADWVSENGAIKTPCDIICGGDCKAIATIEKSSIERCKEIVMKWLQKQAEEEKK